MSDIDALRRSNVNLPDLGRVLIQSFLRHAVRDGFFHADMHPGNLFLTAEGRLAAVDFGIMGRLGLKERRFLAEILYGFITRDYQRVAEVHFEAGYVPAHYRVADFAQAIRAVGEPIHSRRADEISMAKLLTLLFEITALFDMQTRIELVMLQKTMVVVEGVARSLDPRLDMWSTAEPVVKSWIEDNLGPRGKVADAGRGLAALTQLATQTPDMLARAGRMAEKLKSIAERGIALEIADRQGNRQGQRRQPSLFALWIGRGLPRHCLPALALRIFPHDRADQELLPFSSSSAAVSPPTRASNSSGFCAAPRSASAPS